MGYYLSVFLSGLRPKTLIASLSPLFIVTAWIHFFKASVTWYLFTLGLISTIAIQIGTNFFNDAIDFKKGADQEGRLGPQRLLFQKKIKVESVYKWAFLFLSLAIITGAPLVYVGGWPILLIGLVSLFLAYSYTGGPFPLAYLGLGELFVVLFFGVIPCLGMAYIYTQAWLPEALILGLSIGIMSASLILINNIRDYKMDKEAGRKTIPIRFGIFFSKALLSVFLLAPSLLISLFFYKKNFQYLSLLPLIVLPSLVRLLKDIFNTDPSAEYNVFLARAGQIQWRWTFFVLASIILCTKFGIPHMSLN